MKKAMLVILAIIIVIGLVWVSIYNNLAATTERINQKQAEIDNQLKRRADLIPNLVSSVKGFMGQEKDLVNSVTNARAKMTTGTTQDKLNANTELNRSLNLIVENYPVVKSDTLFKSLQDELAGSENRIAVARKGYNDEVGTFNALIKTYPTKIIASMSGFTAKTYLEVTETEKETPVVQF